MDEKSPLLDSADHQDQIPDEIVGRGPYTAYISPVAFNPTEDVMNHNVPDEVIGGGLYSAFMSSVSKSGLHHSSSVKEDDKSRCHRPRIIEPVVFLFYLAYNCAVPIQEQYVTMIAREHYTKIYGNEKDVQDHQYSLPIGELTSSQTASTCSITNNTAYEALIEDLIQSQSSLWLLYIKLAGTIPAMFSTLIICSYGDIGGRKLGILLPPAGSAIKTILFVLAIYFDSPLYLLFIANIIEGIFGSHLTYMGSSYAYMADSTPGPQRPIRFTILQTANVLAGLAHIPFGYWIDASGYVDPFWFVTAVYIFAFFYTLILIPESHPPIDDVKVLENGSNIIGIFQRAMNAFWIYTKQANQTRMNQIGLILLLCSFNCRVLFEMGKSAVETLFMLASPLCLSSTQIGYYNATSSFVHGIIGLIGTVVFLRCFSEDSVCIVFMLSAIAGRFVFAYAESIQVLITSPIASFGQTATLPLTRAMMSRLVSPHQQGALFATVFTLESVCEVFSGALFNSIYAATVAVFKGAVFLVQAGILGLSAILLIVYYAIVIFFGKDRVNYKPPCVIVKVVES